MLAAAESASTRTLQEVHLKVDHLSRPTNMVVWEEESAAVLAAASEAEVALTRITRTINRTAKVRKEVLDPLEVEHVVEEQPLVPADQTLSYHQSQIKSLWAECVACQACLEAKEDNQVVKGLNREDREEAINHRWVDLDKVISNQIWVLGIMRLMYRNTAQAVALVVVSAEAMALAA